jgi:hypothetical protein
MDGKVLSLVSSVLGLSIKTATGVLTGVTPVGIVNPEYLVMKAASISFKVVD